MKKYQIIYADPPWPVRKIIRKCRPNQVVMDYPVMEMCDNGLKILSNGHCWPSATKNGGGWHTSSTVRYGVEKDGDNYPNGSPTAKLTLGGVYSGPLNVYQTGDQDCVPVGVPYRTETRAADYSKRHKCDFDSSGITA